MTAAGSAYATHGEPMIPFYIFYSMFGFQRTGDSIWAMADQLARGFLIGATAGRTTLTGEGLQHADGHSPLLAATNPAVVHYDPAFAYEISHIVQDGLRADVRPARSTRRRGRHLLPDRLQRADRRSRPSPRTSTSRASSRASTTSVRDRRAATGPRGAAAGLRRRLPVGRGGAAACSPRSGASRPTSGRSPRGTSWRRDAVEAEEWNLLHPGEQPRTAYVTDKLARRRGPGRGGLRLHARRPDSDRPLGARRLPRRWAPTASASPTPVRPRAATSTSTPSRWSCRRSRRSPTPGQIERETVEEAFAQYRIDDPTAVAGVKQEGGDA